MKAKIKSGAWVTLPDREIRWKVQVVHRDGTVSLLAGWKLTPEGKDVAMAAGGYLGDQTILRRVPAIDLTPWEYEQAFNLADVAGAAFEMAGRDVAAMADRLARGPELTPEEQAIFDMLDDE